MTTTTTPTTFYPITSPTIPARAHVFASTSLDLVMLDPSITKPKPTQLYKDHGKYRYVSPDYFLWITSRVERMRAAIADGKIEPEDAERIDHMERAYERLAAWHDRHHSSVAIKQAKRAYSGRSYKPPMSNEEVEVGAGIESELQPDCNLIATGRIENTKPDATPCTPIVRQNSNHKLKPIKPEIKQIPDGYSRELPPYIRDIVEARMDEFLAAGWTLEQVINGVSRLRFPYQTPGKRYGVAHYLFPGDTFGKISKDEVEIIRKSGVVHVERKPMHTNNQKQLDKHK